CLPQRVPQGLAARCRWHQLMPHVLQQRLQRHEVSAVVVDDQDAGGGPWSHVLDFRNAAGVVGAECSNKKGPETSRYPKIHYSHGSTRKFSNDEGTLTEPDSCRVFLRDSVAILRPVLETGTRDCRH